MEMILMVLISSLAVLVALNIYKNNRIDKMENELKQLKNDMAEIRGVIYR